MTFYFIKQVISGYVSFPIFVLIKNSFSEIKNPVFLLSWLSFVCTYLVGLFVFWVEGGSTIFLLTRINFLVHNHILQERLISEKEFFCSSFFNSSIIKFNSDLCSLNSSLKDLISDKAISSLWLSRSSTYVDEILKHLLENGCYLNLLVT